MILALLMAAQVPPPEEAACRAGPAEVLVGEPYHRHVPRRARELSGARTVRVLFPGQAMTMDYRIDRVNIRVDHRRTITAIRCG